MLFNLHIGMARVNQGMVPGYSSVVFLYLQKMDFGRIDHIEAIDFSLPPDDSITNGLWQQLQAGPLPAQAIQLYVGGTGWGQKNWIGKVYPKGTKDKDFLAHYVRQFNGIELNTLFYGLQPREVISRWASLAGPGFRFCPKFSNTISHQRQLQQTRQETDLFLDHMQSFGDRLGYSFLQLSDRFAPNRAQLLQAYVRDLPRDFRTCVELRHEDWFAPPHRHAGESASTAVADTWQSFRESGIGTVITDTPGRRDCLHMRLTAPVAFIRFVGNNGHSTDFPRIDAWADRIRTWIDKGLREIYFFVHCPEELNTPELCRYAVEQFNSKCGTALIPPKLFNEGPGTNLSLF